MSSGYSFTTSDELDDYPKVTQADLDRATFRVNLKPTPRKRRVTMLWDTGLVEYFKAQAGERGYQTLINETLRRAMEQDELEERLRRIIRAEIHHPPEAIANRILLPILAILFAVSLLQQKNVEGAQ